MQTENKSEAFILSETRFGEESKAIIHSLPIGPGITISQQTGSGAHTIAEQVAGILQQAELTGAEKWRVFDRQLVEQALEEHHLPKKFADQMREDRRHYIDDVL